MVDFITIECNPAGQLNFFHSGSYTRSSFSTQWRTKDAPETDGLGTTPVYLQVLEKFNIPVDSTNGLPPGGFLPGIDIKNMPAIDAIRFSMAEALTVGQWWEIIEDGEGGVRFINVFDNGSPGKTVTLDVRLCIPTTSKQNEVDMVIVRGYNPPPQRYAGEFRDVIPAGTGEINPEQITGDEDLFTIDFASMAGNCLESQLKTESTKSYKDPLIEGGAVTQFGPQEKNPFFSPGAFESLISWAIDIDGMEESPQLAARVKYSFSPTTTWYVRPTPAFPTFEEKSEPTDTGCSATGLQIGGDVVFYEGEILYTSPNRIDRYGDLWPLVVRPATILYTGYKLDAIHNFGGTGGVNIAYVNPIPEFNELAEGSQWIYTIPSEGQYAIRMYYTPKIDPVTWGIILSFTENANTVLKVNDGKPKLFDNVSEVVDSKTGIGILGGQNNLGHIVTDLWLGLTIDRPSVTVTDPQGEALEYLSRLRVRYAPLILFDPPAPIAYKHKDFGSVIVDQAASLPDNDPTTCQAFDDTPEGIMQDRMQGNVLDLTLPFCEGEAACLKVAETIFDYQSYTNAQTHTLTCGPDDEPELGAAVDGFDTNLRIESINYNYQDSSAYTIEVTLGSVFADVGSWNSGTWIPKTADVARKAIVIYTAGDGVNYRVRVQGLGEFNAINSTKSIWRVGEHVDVTVYNIPQEK